MRLLLIRLLVCGSIAQYLNYYSVELVFEFLQHMDEIRYSNPVYEATLTNRRRVAYNL